jgi:hypothetical protein
MQNARFSEERNALYRECGAFVRAHGEGGLEQLVAITAAFKAGYAACNRAAEVKAENPKKEESGETAQD